MRLSTYGKPRIVSCAQDYPHHIGLPRGCLDEVVELLADLNVTPIIRDERFSGRPIAASFHGELRPDQQAAAEAMLAHDTGVLSATTAFGKTVIGAWLIAKRGVNTLVLVHRRQLQEQWIERLSTFLGLPPRAIGRIGGGSRKPTGAVDVAVDPELGSQRGREGIGAALWPADRRRMPSSLRAQLRTSRPSRQGEDSSRDCPRRSRGRTATIRSSSCSVARCAIASMPGCRRPPGRSSTPPSSVRPAFGPTERSTPTSAFSSTISTTS